MKRVYCKPEMEMEKFQAEQNVAAGNCRPGVDEKKENSKTVSCNKPALTKCSSKTTIFADSSKGCSKVFKSENDFVTVYWEEGGWHWHSDHYGATSSFNYREDYNGIQVYHYWNS
ncbi:MAG: hypothetical protein Q4E53_13255 [Eubacteriales bacterium]|nr:hypothetical protein [Eubacteriales bacterium]